MIYTDLTKKAMIIAFEAHKDQLDKAGVPYVFHPIHIAEQMDTENAVIIALLHDVVEDTDTSLDKIAIQGFSAEIIAAIRLLTHNKGQDYLDYIRHIAASGNQDAIKVKLADLRHNSDIARLSKIDKRLEEKIAKYHKAMEILIKIQQTVL